MRMQKRARGFSMIELLVAVLIMGIGVLGISGLQLVSLQNNRAALQRAEAVQLAYDMMDRMRANQTVANDGGPYDDLILDDAPNAPTNCNTSDCNAAAMAAFDVAVWKCALGSYNDNATCTTLRDDVILASADLQPGLPDGDGTVTIDANGVITIMVQWVEQGGAIRNVTINSQS